MARTITYNEYINFTRIYRATSGGTVFSSDLSAQIAFDLFGDSAVVGDAIYFGFHSPQIEFDDLKFYIGTALAATGITLVWEYSTGTSTWTTLTVTDNTNSFQNTGENTVQFTPPTSPNWNNGTVNGVSATWVRVRISAVSGLTEGGAQSTQTIQCLSRAIIVSDSGAEVSAFCQALYDADVAGGWGVVSKQGDKAFLFACHIFLGYPADADITTISDTLKFIEIDGVIWARKVLSKIISGTLVDAEKLTTKNGCYWFFTNKMDNFFAQGYGQEKWHFFSSMVSGGAPYGLAKLLNSIINAGAFHSWVDATQGPIVNNINYQVTRSDFGTNSLFANSIINRVQTSDASYATRLEFNAYIRKLVNVNCPYIGDANNNATTIYDTVLIDAESDAWDVYWLSYPTNGGEKTFRMYSVNIQVLDQFNNPIENAVITIKDKDGNDSIYVEKGRVTNIPGSSGTTFTVDTNIWSIGDYAKIGGEIVLLTAGTYPNFTMTRAQKGTRACSQDSRQAMRLYPQIETDSSGNSGEMLVEIANYQWASGSKPGVTTETAYNPFTIEIRKSGYKTYKKEFTLDEKIDWRIALQRVKDLNFSKKAKLITQ